MEMAVAQTSDGGELYGDFGNEILYQMCKSYPLHNNIDVVHGKLWLIGRAYAAALERQAGKNFTVRKGANILIESKIDAVIRGISVIRRVDESNIDQMLDAHHYLTQLFQRATGKCKRSLASKYLHFHAPDSVFIYDSLADKRLREILKGVMAHRRTRAGQHDFVYADFAQRCMYYRDHILEPNVGHDASPRAVDKSLYPLKFG